MASKSGWTESSIPGTIGNDQTNNNSSGFNAIPAGQRVRSNIFPHFKFWAFGEGSCMWTSTPKADPTAIWLFNTSTSMIAPACMKEVNSILCVV